MNAPLERELELARAAAQQIGQLQLKHYESDFRVLRKEVKEFVSTVDMACHDLALRLLREGSPHPVHSEEVRGRNEVNSERYWVVDPLDGSHNFIAGLPNFGVSIALVDRGRFALGVLGIPFHEQLLHAVDGQGAFLNGAPVRVSDNADLSKAMIAYDNQFHMTDHMMDRYRGLVQRAFTTRIMGSAAYDLSLIVRGKIDGRVWNRTKVFDFAAGVVLVREAGGRVTDFAGNDVGVQNREVVASNGKIHDDLLACLELP